MTTISISSILFLISSIQIISHLALAEVVMRSCLNSNNYTSNSTYAANLATLISSFTESNSTFLNISTGQEPERVFGFAMCRGDLSPASCKTCLNTSAAKILTLCPNKKRGFAWFDLCMIRYSDEPMYGALVDNKILGHWTNSETANATVFWESLYPLLSSLMKRAASGDSRLKAAAANVSVEPLFLTLYGMTQCSPDLSEGECLSCLATIASYIQKWCYDKRGSRICAPSCYLRYETYTFYESSAADVTLGAPVPISPPPEQPQEESEDHAVIVRRKVSGSRVAVIVLVPAFAFVILVICICVILRRRNSDQKVQNPDDILPVESLQIDFNIVRDATNGFSELNKIGEGGFGAVYKGELPDGRPIAAKRLSASSGQGDQEFKNEVLLVAKLQHKNLVRLLGFCLERKEKILVYEFVHNASLDHYIFDRIKRVQLSWDKRYNIIKGIVRGLVYLHEDSRLRIIHRDLKAGNVLLDAKMEPKISDFGMAKLIEMDQTHGDTRKIAGTYGYMAPEYAYKGYFSVKSDVFSFGVLVLEIVAGQRNGRFQDGQNVEDLKSYAWKSWRQGTGINMVDPMLRDCGSMGEMLKCIQIGLLCVQENAASRPTMELVNLMLNSDSTTIAAPEQPAFFVHTTVDEPDRPIGIGPVQDSVTKHSVTELSGR